VERLTLFIDQFKPFKDKMGLTFYPLVSPDEKKFEFRTRPCGGIQNDNDYNLTHFAPDGSGKIL